MIIHRINISSVMRQKRESQNGCYEKKKKHFKFSGKRTGDKKCSSIGKFGMLCFLVTPVLRHVFLPYEHFLYTFINPLHATGIVLYSLKTTKPGFSDLFIVYRKRPMAQNVLNQLHLPVLNTYWVYFLRKRKFEF